MKKLFLIIILLFFIGCYPNKIAIQFTPEEISNYKIIKSPTKVFLFDTSVILFPDGFEADIHRITGMGQRYWFNGEDYRLKQIAIPLDSIAMMTYYELKHTGGGSFGSFLLGLYGTLLTPLSIYCISCPKCCFGSCPTVYLQEQNDYRLKAELFSYSISKYHQETDLDRLFHRDHIKEPFQIRLTNEALETHYINQLSLLKVDHPQNTSVFPSNQGKFIITKCLSNPTYAVNSMGKNILNLVNKYDMNWYRSDTTLIKKLGEGINMDWLDVKLNVPVEAKTVKLMLRIRNTLLSTVLFYDVVLASQGIGAVEWANCMNNNPLYAFQFDRLYKSYAGIKVKVNQNGKWKKCSSIGDVGPLVWKEIAVEIPVAPNSIDSNNEMNIRLEFFPDNFYIDYIAYEVEYTHDKSLTVQELFPSAILDVNGNHRNDLIELFKNDDSQFLVTNPGESYFLKFVIPKNNESATSVFIRSKGYYTEWLRGDWIKLPQHDDCFSIHQVDHTIKNLKESWLNNRQLLEVEFFKTRIPLMEVL